MPGLEIKRGAIAWVWVRVLGVGEGSRQSKQKRHPETTPEGPFRGAGPEEDSQADRVASVPHQENASRTGKGDKGRGKKIRGIYRNGNQSHVDSDVPPK